MAAPIHTHRHVDSIQNIDLGMDERRILESINRRLAQDDIRWVIVMPSQGIIHALRTAYNYSEDKESTPEALSTALQALGFFTETAPPTVVPKEIVTPVECIDPHFSVELTLYPERRTTYQLMK